MRNLTNKQNIIIKIGSSSLCDEKGLLSKEKILSLVQQIVELKRRNKNIIIVTSGAINAGMQALNLDSKPTKIADKQALAAIGQAKLMQIYEELFKLYDYKVGQVLLNHDDFDDRKRLMNLYYAIESLIAYNAIVIINENDTLAVDEIRVGDNDTLASLLVPILDADLLILVSDIDGLYDANPSIDKDAKLISNVDGVDSKIEQYAKDTNSNVGTGGMKTKIKAAKIANDYGCDMAIVNGQTKNVIIDLIDNKNVGTYFDGSVGRILSSRDHWIMYRSSVKGKIIVDNGAKESLINKHTSLLPKGIIDVEGSFMDSSVIDIVDQTNKVIARGITNYSSSEINLIKGANSNEIEDILHYKDHNEVVHANNLVLFKEN